MNIIVRIVTGVIQDKDNDSYDHVTIVYSVLAGLSVVVSLALVVLAWWSMDLRELQWTRKGRIANGEQIRERKEMFLRSGRNRRLSLVCFGLLVLLTMGGWCAYFWGVATGNND